jgi:UDP-glucose 4-epimerase
MRVTVVGATGNVGTAVVEALAADERVSEIVGVARRRPDLHPPKTTYVAADVAEHDLVPLFRGSDVVVHLAWMFQPTHKPLVTWEANAVGSSRVFDAAAEAGVGSVVYSSSVGAYSPGEDEVDESWPTHSVPTAGYGREKAYVERVLDAFEARHPDMRVVRLRPSFIFQRRSASEQRRIFAGPFLPTPLLRQGRLPVVPWPAGLRFQALHAKDVAEAYRLATVRDDARGAYNVAADPVVDQATVGELLGARTVPVPGTLARTALAGLWQLRVVPAEPALLDLALMLPLLDTSRIRNELGWQPTVSSVEAMREVIEGMADHAGERTAPLSPDTVHGRLREVVPGS